MRFNRKKTSIIVLLFVASLLGVLVVPMVKAQTSTTTVTVTPQSSTPVVGQTFTINIQLSNVQNLYALDVTLDYNSVVLQLVNSKVDLGTSSIPGGVLYGSPVTDDENNIASGAVYYNTSLSTASEYHLFATSVNPAGAFSGSGTIATLTFKVTNAGDSNLTLASTLANYAPDGTSEPIAHTDVSGTVDATLSSSASSDPLVLFIILVALPNTHYSRIPIDCNIIHRYHPGVCCHRVSCEKNRKANQRSNN